MNKQFKKDVMSAKKDFYKKTFSDLMNKNTSKWYSTMKKITSHDQHTREKIIIQEINRLTDQEQSEKLAEHFAEVPNQYDQHSKDDIKFKPINNENIPQFTQLQKK